MPYFILGVSLFVAVLLLAQWFVNANPTQIVKFLRYSAASILGLIAIFMLVNGRIGAAIPLFIGVLMALGKWPGRGFGVPNFGRMFGQGSGRPTSGQASEAATGWLRMRLDHDSGDMSGEVLKGRFAGQQLSALSLAELAELLGACHGEDEQSATLLATYLERVHGPDWQEQAFAAGGGGDAGAAASTSAMTVEEARDILGVGPDAGDEQIREAHRAMMKKLHPDQGGSTYLARAINAAKDLLLKK